jgi:hypothetical protein
MGSGESVMNVDDKKSYDEFINTVGDQIKNLPLIALIFINKLVAQELMLRFNEMAEEVLKSKRN